MPEGARPDSAPEDRNPAGGPERHELLLRPGSARRATFLELFFDLVFVFALNRVSERFIVNFTVERGDLLAAAGGTLLLFLAFWLVWYFIATTSSRLDPDHPFVQSLVVGTMLGAMVMAIAVPSAFGRGGIVFAGTYLLLQVGRPVAGLVFTRRRREPAFYYRLIFWHGLGAVPWVIGGALTEDSLRATLWAVGVAIDFTGLVLDWPTPTLGRSRISEWSIGAQHLAERYQQFLLITLGESILVIGLSSTGTTVGSYRTIALLVAFLTTALLWRMYFHQAGHLLPAAIAAARHPARLGRTTSYVHLLMTAGIVLTTVGYELSIAHPRRHTVIVCLYAIVGGPVLFLAGRLLLEYQVFGRITWPRPIGLAMLVSLAPVLVELPSLAVAAAAVAILAGIAAADTLRSIGRARVEPAPPG